MISALASACAEFCTFPLDTTKTRMQIATFARERPISPKHTSVDHFGTHFDPRYTKFTTSKPRGMLRTMRRIIRREGARGLYKGVSPAMTRATVNSGVSLALYRPVLHVFLGGAFTDVLDPEFHRNQGSLSNRERESIGLLPKLGAAGVSGMLTQFIACPIDVIKVRMQADGHLKVPRYRSPFHAFVSIARKHGPLKFWTGLGPSLQRSMLSVGTTVGSYDHTKTTLMCKYGWEDALPCHVAGSLVSGLAASLTSCPFDVIKTRMQFQSMSRPKYTSAFDCFMKMARKESPRAFFKGLIPMYIRLAPWQLIFFVSYEQISRTLTGTTF